MEKILLVDYPNVDGATHERVLKELGYEVKFFDFIQSPYLTSNTGKKIKNIVKNIISYFNIQPRWITTMQQNKINLLLTQVAKQYQPDIVLIVKGATIYPDTLKKIKTETKAIIVNWYGDSLLTDGAKEFVEKVSQYYDYFFIIDDMDVLNYVKVSSSKVYSIPFGCDITFYKKVLLTQKEKKYYGADVTFVGTMVPSRVNVLEQLTNFNLKIWAPETNIYGKWLTRNSPLKKFYQGRDVSPEEAVKIYNASKIVLDIHFLFGTEQKIFNVTKRVFEVPACGGFVLTNYCDQLKKLFNVGEEIVSYNDIDDLKRKIEYYLLNDNERNKVVKNSFLRVTNEHTWKNRFIKIMNLLKQ